MYHYSREDSTNLKYYCILGKVLSANRRFEDKITCKDVLNLLKRFNFSCAYCSKRVPPKNWQLDHFYSRAMGGKNKIDNLAPACKWCNQMKNALDGWSFLHKCKEIAEKNMLQVREFNNNDRIVNL